ncbi:hypothetical protein [Phycicoccus flavus]|uniref:hypothetical protein n=1 Tax=Phycicoccus flavus TaxID=2502783 RepID=UPI000FEC02AA|nr:hypothetical protein [Phycicoccus flavus]NHA69450.1 hypothetical protein [Phycicoccus flavus]
MVRGIVWSVLGAVVVGALAGVLGTIGLSVGASGLSVGGSVLGRSVLTLVAVAFLAVLLARRGPWPWLVPPLGVLAAGYALDPLTWTVGADAGGALFGRWLTGSVPVGLVVDLLVWLAVAAGAALLGLRTREDAWD